MNSTERFLKALAKDSRLIEKLERGKDLSSFKEEFQVVRATPLKCPACASIQQSPGSLWAHKEFKDRFTCRKCRVTYHITAEPVSTEQLILRLRAIKAGDRSASLQWNEEDLDG